MAAVTSPHTSQPLSEREKEILNLLATGATNQEIARALYISPNTVKVHLRNIYAKLGVTNRSEAIMVGLREGYITLPGMEPTPPSAQPSLELSEMPVGTPYLGKILLLSALLGLLSVLWLALWPVWAGSRVIRARDSTFTDLGRPNAGLPLRRDAPRWAPLTPMTTPRSRMAVAVWQGKVFVFGGEGANGVLPSAAVLDPARGVWDAIAPLPTAVSNVQAAVLDDRIYIFGGTDDTLQPTDRIQVYDPVEDRWQDGGRLPHPLAGYALAVWQGQVYVFGGWDGEQYLATVYAFDPKSGRWTSLPPLPGRRAFAAAVTTENAIYLIGGFDGQTDLAEVWAFNPEALSRGLHPWSPLPAMLTPRGGGWATALNQNIYVVGGGIAVVVDGAERYDPNTGTWARITTPYGPNWRHMGGAAIGGDLILVGGWAGSPLPFVEQYRVSFRQFIPFGPVNVTPPGGD